MYWLEAVRGMLNMGVVSERGSSVGEKIRNYCSLSYFDIGYPACESGGAALSFGSSLELYMYK